MRHSLAVLGVLAISAAAAPSLSSQAPSLAGAWKLNVAESDKPMEKLKDASSAAPKVNDGYGSMKDRVGAGRIAGEPGGSSGSGGGRSGGGGAAAGGGGGNMSLPGPDFGRIMHPGGEVTVEQSDTTITIADGQSLPQVFFLDGRKVEEPGSGEEPKQTTAKWKDGKLTVEKKLGSIGTIRETYAVDAAKHRLVVDAKLTSSQLGKTLEIRRVYDPKA